MSLRTHIHGFTAWVNLRLKPSDQLMNNVLMDLLRGTSMKLLLHSLTGSEIARLQSFDNKVIPGDVYVDTRLFAMRSADHIFELLWRLVCHDIWFLWERAEYLQQDSDEVLAQVPFKWVPEAPPPKRKPNVKTATSLLSGFASSSILREEQESTEPDPMATYDPFPNSELMKQFKTRTLEDGKYPPPEDCVLEMVKAQLMTVDDLADSRVLCALVNSFVPNTFTTEVLLNDRWTMNLVLRSTEKMFYMHSPFDSEDLLEADTMSVCSFFCAFFMLAYKYRQSYSVVSWLDHIRMLRQQWEAELAKIPPCALDEGTTHHRDQVLAELTQINKAIGEIENNFDMEFCNKWLEHVDSVVKETHNEIRQKFQDRFETLIVPRNITVGHLCLSLGINLSLTNGSGFYLAEGSKKEVLSEMRKLVLQEKMTGVYFDDFTGKRKGIYMCYPF
ncbi:hypothetical protein LSAT2_006967 [Lamellibrachia satsuma]|nr:hypothetical protein LSAT2_006967 [Lamellibrachia satsuma]